METTVRLPVKKVISDGMMGMIFLLAAEIMLFAGFISAYVVGRSSILVWPPYGQPRLPAEVTAFNTLILTGSAIVLAWFARNYRKGEQSRKLLLWSMLLGTLFLVIQGTEWAKLIGYGLTTSSSIYGAFFYTIIGAHAFHTVAGLIILLYLFSFLKRNPSREKALDKIAVCGLYWYFVAGLWPVLYILVYLM